jgi:hypothetical protein
LLAILETLRLAGGLLAILGTLRQRSVLLGVRRALRLAGGLLTVLGTLRPSFGLLDVRRALRLAGGLRDVRGTLRPSFGLLAVRRALRLAGGLVAILGTQRQRYGLLGVRRALRLAGGLLAILGTLRRRYGLLDVRRVLRLAGGLLDVRGTLLCPLFGMPDVWGPLRPRHEPPAIRRALRDGQGLPDLRGYLRPRQKPPGGWRTLRLVRRMPEDARVLAARPTLWTLGPLVQRLRHGWHHRRGGRLGFQRPDRFSQVFLGAFRGPGSAPDSERPLDPMPARRRQGEPACRTTATGSGPRRWSALNRTRRPRR